MFKIKKDGFFVRKSFKLAWEEVGADFELFGVVKSEGNERRFR